MAPVELFKRSVFSFLALALLGSVGCATPIELVEPPNRKADVYPAPYRSSGLVVAVDPIVDPGRAERYFGIDPNQHGILPAQIVVTNLGQSSMAVEPADVLVVDGRSVIDPVPASRVAELMKQTRGYLGRRTQKKVDAYFSKIDFSDQVIPPGQSISGIVFFDVGVDVEDSDDDDDDFMLIEYFPSPSLYLRMATTDVESGQRLHFGPFQLDR